VRYLRIVATATLIAVALIVCLEIAPYNYNILLDTGSMEPSYSGGDIVVIKENYNKINKGDVIVFKTRQGNIMHRVIRVNDIGYITQGDNLPAPDPYVWTDEAINGVVVAKVEGFWLTDAMSYHLTETYLQQR